LAIPVALPYDTRNLRISACPARWRISSRARGVSRLRWLHPIPLQLREPLGPERRVFYLAKSLDINYYTY
jgi:hypothetical protein